MAPGCCSCPRATIARSRTNHSSSVASSLSVGKRDIDRGEGQEPGRRGTDLGFRIAGEAQQHVGHVAPRDFTQGPHQHPFHFRRGAIEVRRDDLRLRSTGADDRVLYRKGRQRLGAGHKVLEQRSRGARAADSPKGADRGDHGCLRSILERLGQHPDRFAGAHASERRQCLPPPPASSKPRLVNARVEQTAPAQRLRETLGFRAVRLFERVEQERLDDLGAERIAAPLFRARTAVDDRVPLGANLDDPRVAAPIETAAPASTRQDERQECRDAEERHGNRLNDDARRARVDRGN